MVSLEAALTRGKKAEFTQEEEEELGLPREPYCQQHDEIAAKTLKCTNLLVVNIDDILALASTGTLHSPWLVWMSITRVIDIKHDKESRIVRNSGAHVYRFLAWFYKHKDSVCKY